MSDSNGALPAALLVTVQDSMQLRTPAALGYQAMKHAAKLAGTAISIAGPYGAYRTLADQRWMKAHPRLYPSKSLASPGTSPHGTGLCVDIVGDLRWAIANASAFGFSRPIAVDVNHFQHDGITRTPATTQLKEADMLIIKNNDDSSTKDSRFLWWPDAAFAPRIIDDTTAATYRAAGIAEHDVDRTRWLRLITDARNDATLKAQTVTVQGAFKVDEAAVAKAIVKALEGVKGSIEFGA